jgi:hypothetical protein
MTRGAVCSIGIGAALRIARRLCCIGRRSYIAEGIGLRPRSESTDDGINLFVIEHSTCTLRKGGHGSAGYSVRGGVANHGIIRNGEKNGIRQSKGCSAPAIHAVASCAVLSIEQIEVDDFARRHYLRAGSRDAA